jgi:hypothetical protein
MKTKTKTIYQVVNLINSNICQLNEAERKTIAGILEYHAYETMAAAEQISEMLGVDYNAVFDLIDF